MPKNPPSDSLPANTIRDWVAWAAQAFARAGLYFGHGTDNAIDEAAYLIAYALKTDFEFAGYAVDQSLSDSENAAIYALLKARIDTRKPAAYLVKEAWFAGYPFYVNEHVLVPRSPLAELISEQFYPWVDAGRVKSVIDIGTGSGCIAIACALYLEDCEVDAVDVDDEALQLTERNIRRHHLEARVKTIKSDLFSQVPARHYDIVISNPPYVSEAEYAALPDEYYREPKLGLTAGADGLDCVRRILKDAPRYLSAQGILIVEVGNSQQALEEAFPAVPFTWLEFEHGGGGVFMLDKRQLDEYRSYFSE